MFKKLDAYIIKKYLSTFFFTVLIFTMISVVIDFSDKVEDFIEEPVTAKQILLHYYLPYIPHINSLLWPLYALISVIFFTSRMAFNSEIISILNAGVSFKRLMFPYLLAAGLIATLHLVGNHFVIPIGNKSRLDFEHTYIWKHSDKGKTRDVHMFTSPTEKVYIKYYRKRDTMARDLRIEQFAEGKLIKMVKAQTAEWQGDPNKWRLRNYEIRTFNGLKETIELGQNKQLDTTINITPADFVRYANEKERMITPELKECIDIERSRGIGNTKIYEIEMHRRTAEPFTIFILTMNGMAVASRKVRGGMGLHLSVGVALGALYIFMSKFSITFATNDNLSPLLGVWIPNIIFSVVAMILISRAQK